MKHQNVQIKQSSSSNLLSLLFQWMRGEFLGSDFIKFIIIHRQNILGKSSGVDQAFFGVSLLVTSSLRLIDT